MHWFTSAILRAAVLAYALCFETALAQQYPVKPIRWVVPLAPGGPIDLQTRAVATEVAAGLGQPVVVDNRAGAANIVGAEAVAKSPPDGYTLLSAPSGVLVFTKFLYRNLPYDPQRDFTPVGFISNSVLGVFVHQSVPARSLQELVAYARANPGKLTYGSSGVGQRFHLATAMLLRRTGIEMVHVPFKGAGQFIPELMAGRIDMILFPPTDQLLSQVKTGRLRVLAMATAERYPVLPEVPTFAESGIKNFSFPDWLAVVVPTGTPKPVIDRLNRELSRAVNVPGVKRVLAENASVPLSATPEQAAQVIASDIKTWGELIPSLGIKPD